MYRHIVMYSIVALVSACGGGGGGGGGGIPPVDNTAPLAEMFVTPSVNQSNQSVGFTISLSEAGVGELTGSCSRTVGALIEGNNDLQLQNLHAGVYSNCQLFVVDAVGNRSEPLAIPSFTIEGGPIVELAAWLGSSNELLLFGAPEGTWAYSSSDANCDISQFSFCAEPVSAQWQSEALIFDQIDYIRLKTGPYISPLMSLSSNFTTFASFVYNNIVWSGLPAGSILFYLNDGANVGARLNPNKIPLGHYFKSYEFLDRLWILSCNALQPESIECFSYSWDGQVMAHEATFSMPPGLPVSVKLFKDELYAFMRNYSVTHVLKSSDGKVWASVAELDFGVEAVTEFDNSLWASGQRTRLGISKDVLQRSTDAISWQRLDAKISDFWREPLDADLTDVIVWQGKAWRWHQGAMISSDDGIAWQEHTAKGLPSFLSPSAVLVKRDKAVLLIEGDAKYESIDMLNWRVLYDPANQPTPNSGPFLEFNQQVLAFPQSAAQQVLISQDMVRWKVVDTSAWPFTANMPNLHSNIVFNGRLISVTASATDTNLKVASIENLAQAPDIVLHDTGIPYRVGYTLTEFSNKLWLIGGNNQRNFFNDVWSSVDGITWLRELSAAAFSARANASIFVLDAKLWLFGGVDEAAAFDDGYDLYDSWVSNDGVNWTQASLAGHPIGVLNDEVVLVVRENELTPEYLYVSGNGQDWRVLTHTLPLESNQFRDWSIVFKDRLYLYLGIGRDKGLWRSTTLQSWQRLAPLRKVGLAQ